MASRMKEDEKNEKIIRGLLKLPENRRCINCNSLGPQYVCTSFNTFICTTCSGIHREFTHRVKSISMAKFTSQEVSALQGGGNQRAKEIYLKDWDSQRNSFPDGSNIDKLRDFIKHVYVDGRFSGGKNFDRPPRMKTGDREDSYGGGSRSPPYEDTYDRRYSDRSSPGGRSPGYEQDVRQYNDYKRSPARPEIINDWRREDRFDNGRKVDDRRLSDGESKVGESPERQKDLDSSSPPVVRPVREILGENVLPLRIGEPPKANGSRVSEVPAETQRTAASSSLASAGSNTAEVKWESSASLIDFDADPEPPVAAQPQPSTTNQPSAQQISSNNENNWAYFDVPPVAKAPQPPNPNNLDSVLLELSMPTSAPGPGGPNVAGGLVAALGGNSAALPIAPAGNAFPPTTVVSSIAAVNTLSNLPQGGASSVAPGLMPTFPSSTVTSHNMQPQQPSLFPAASLHPSQQSAVPINVTPSNQAWNPPLAVNPQGPSSTVSSHPFQAVLHPPQAHPRAAAPQQFSEEAKHTRKELPADLFTTTYSAYQAPVSGWHAAPAYGMGYNMPNNFAMTMPAFPPPSKSVNPFDINEPSPVQAPTFPSMSSLQNALPGLPPPSSIVHNPSMGTPSTAWLSPPASSYMSAVPPVAPSQSTTLPPGAYMMQQMPNATTVSRHPGVGGFNSGVSSFSSMNSNPLVASNLSMSHTPNPSASLGGNPFG